VSILRRDAALNDLIDLAYYIAFDSVEAAYRFLDQVEESFRDLEDRAFNRAIGPFD
jgi:plasmid stabilization system protein ParE